MLLRAAEEDGHRLVEVQGELLFAEATPPVGALKLERVGEGQWSLRIEERMELLGREVPLARPTVLCRKNAEGVRGLQVFRSRILFSSRPNPIFKSVKKVLD